MGITTEQLGSILTEQSIRDLMATLGGKVTDKALILVKELNEMAKKKADEKGQGFASEFAAKKKSLVKEMMGAVVAVKGKFKDVDFDPDIKIIEMAADGLGTSDEAISDEKERAVFDAEVLKIVDEGPKASATEITKLRHALNCAQGNARELETELKRFDLPAVNFIEDLKKIGVIEESMDLSTQTAVKVIKYCAEQTTRFLQAPRWVMNVKGVEELVGGGVMAAGMLRVTLDMLSEKVKGEAIEDVMEDVARKVPAYLSMLHIVDTSLDKRTRQLMQECTSCLRGLMKIEGDDKLSDNGIIHAYQAATAIIAELMEANKHELNLRMAEAFGIIEIIDGLKAIVGMTPGQIVLDTGDADKLRLYFTWLLGKDGVVIHPEKAEACAIDMEKDSIYSAWVKGCRDVDEMARFRQELINSQARNGEVMQ